MLNLGFSILRKIHGLLGEHCLTARAAFLLYINTSGHNTMGIKLSHKNAKLSL
jgi:hypothetical protein